MKFTFILNVTGIFVPAFLAHGSALGVRGLAAGDSAVYYEGAQTPYVRVTLDGGRAAGRGAQRRGRAAAAAPRGILRERPFGGPGPERARSTWCGACAVGVCA